MIELFVDALLYIILLAAILFGWISVVGLLLFPDIRSRAFTGIRAGLIATGLVTAAAIVFGLYKWVETNGAIQYPVYAGAAVLLCVLLMILNWAGSRALCRQAVMVRQGSGPAAGTGDETGKKE